MKVQIRRNVFETNSSSTHSLTIIPEKIYEGWKEKRSYAFDSYRELFIKVEFKFKPLEEMTKEEEFYVRENYHEVNPYSYTSFDKLSPQEQEIWYQDYQIKETYGSQYDVYEVWQEKSYWLSNRGEVEQYYTSPSGDKLVAFGYYGYDG